MSKKDSPDSFDIGSITYRIKKRTKDNQFGGSVFFYSADDTRGDKVSDLPFLPSENARIKRAHEIAERHHNKHFKDDIVKIDEYSCGSLLSFEAYWGLHKPYICEVFAWSTTSSSTFRQYELIVENGIANRFGDKPISRITTEDCERVLKESIANAETDEPENLKKRYKNILFRIFKYAVSLQDVKLNPVLGMEDSFEESIASITRSLIRERLATKTIPIEQVKNIYQYVKLRHLIYGELLGLAIMLFTGLRTSEVCGLSFKEFIEMKDYPGQYYIRVVERRSNKTVTTNQLKTENAYRKVPVISILAELILEKKDLLNKKFPTGTDIGKMYIVCAGESYDSPCLDGHLSLFIRDVLETANVKNRMLIVPPVVRDAKESLEPDPESYLLRRHAISYAYSPANLDERSISYFAAHSLNGKDFNTTFPYRDYGNEDKLHEMLNKLERITYWITGDRKECSIRIDGQNRAALFEDVDYQRIVVTLEPGESVNINLSSRKVNEPINLEIISEKRIQMFKSVSGYSPEASETTNITGSYQSYVVPSADTEDDSPLDDDENNLSVNSLGNAFSTNKQKTQSLCGPESELNKGTLNTSEKSEENQKPKTRSKNNETTNNQGGAEHERAKHNVQVIKDFKEYLGSAAANQTALGNNASFNAPGLEENITKLTVDKTCEAKGSETNTYSTSEKVFSSIETVSVTPICSLEENEDSITFNNYNNGGTNEIVDNKMEIISSEINNQPESTVALYTSMSLEGQTNGIADDVYLCVFTQNGYVKRIQASKFVRQNKATTGRYAITCRPGDYVKFVLLAAKEDRILLFGSAGNAFSCCAEKIPDMDFEAKGNLIKDIFDITVEGEVFTAGVNLADIVPAQSTSKDSKNIIIVTKNGLIKSLNTQLVIGKKRSLNGIRAITLDVSDEVVSVLITSGDSHLLLAASDGMTLCVSENEIRTTGRQAKGRMGIKMNNDACCIGAAIMTRDVPILSLTSNGIGRRSDPKEYYPGENENKPAKCGGKGLIGYDIDDDTGTLTAVTSAPDGQELFVINKKGKLLHISCNNLTVQKRRTKGYCVMKTSEPLVSCSVTI